MKKILVTGGAGFIGSFLVDKLIEMNNEVTIYDNLDPQVHLNGKPPDYLNKNARFIKGDVLDYDSFKKAAIEAEYIVHFAARVGVGQSQYEIKKYVDVNIGGTANLLDIIANNKNKLKKMLVAASMSGYGEGAYLCKKEKTTKRPNIRTEEQMARGEWEPVCPDCGGPLEPIPTSEKEIQICNSIYAITKKVQEDMVIMIGKAYGIPAVATRFFNVFGPRQSLSNPYTGVAAIFMSRIKNDHRPVVFEDGLQTRDFIYVTDIAKACIMALENEKADYNIYNVGSGKAHTIKSIAESIAKVYGKQIEPEITKKFRKGDVRHCFADISKIKKELNFSTDVDFETGMRKLIEWSRTATAVDNYEKAQKEMIEKKII